VRIPFKVDTMRVTCVGGNTPSGPWALTSVNGDSNSRSGGITPFCVSSSMTSSMNSICSGVALPPCSSSLNQHVEALGLFVFVGELGLQACHPVRKNFVVVSRQWLPSLGLGVALDELSLRAHDEVVDVHVGDPHHSCPASTATRQAAPRRH